MWTWTVLHSQNRKELGKFWQLTIQFFSLFHFIFFYSGTTTAKKSMQMLVSKFPKNLAKLII